MSRQPRVVIDGRMVGPVPHGISRYVSLIAKGLAEQRELSFSPLFLVQPGMSDAFSGFETEIVQTPFLDLKEPFLLPFVLKRLKPDLYHSPSFSSLTFCPCPYLVTVHDLNHLKYGGRVEKIYYETLLKPFVQKSKETLTVSEFSKKELERWIPKTSTSVIYNAIDPGLKKEFTADPSAISEVLNRFQLVSGKYFLTLSNSKPHKNLPTLVRAFQRFRELSLNFNDYKLAMTVKNYLNEPNVIGLGGISDFEMKVLMKHAAALPFPSYYEGFGLPPIEAASMGVIPLPSRIPAHEEAFQKALAPADLREIYFSSPDRVEDWVVALKAVVDKKIRPPSEKAQTDLLSRYSVEKLGQEIKVAYERNLK